MALAVEVQNVSPIGDVQVFVDGESVVVPAGQTISVTPEAAGQAPRWRRATEDEAALAGVPAPGPGVHIRERGGHVEVFDLGSGLLAQPSNWRKAGDTTAPADPLDAGGGQLVGEQDPEPITLADSAVVNPTETENS